MIEQDNAVIINESFTLLPGLLVKWGVVLKQKYGYKAGKISRTRNWCQPIDGDKRLRMYFPNSEGKALLLADDKHKERQNS